MRHSTKAIAPALSLMLASCIPAGGASENLAGASQTLVAGAGFTTFDASIGGCLDGPNGVNCNNYEAMDAVYMSGGPVAASLSDGAYHFAVLAPGHQNGGALDGSDGNLSDLTAGATDGDLGAGDPVENRTFIVSGGEIVAYAGSHAWGTSPAGRAILALAPFDATDNPGGVYILAICRAGSSDPAECKFDAFRLRDGEGSVDEFPEVSGAKYYDANTNGQLDPGEPMIAGWPIRHSDEEGDILLTSADGSFSVELVEGAYHFAEVLPQPGSAWIQTGNRIDQSSTAGGASVSLQINMTYDLMLADNSSVAGILFGNVCLGAGGGRTLGFWSNRNGKALVQADDLAHLRSLNLRSSNGADFDPADYGSLRAWLLGANATNMACMLSAQLATMELNVWNGLVQESRLIFAPGTASANASGFATVGAVMREADESLGAHGNTPSGAPERSYQEALKDALDGGNNDRSFVQPGPGACPIPVFP